MAAGMAKPSSSSLQLLAFQSLLTINAQAGDEKQQRSAIRCGTRERSVLCIGRETRDQRQTEKVVEICSIQKAYI